MASCLWTTVTHHLKFSSHNAIKISSPRLPRKTHLITRSGRRAGICCTTADSENSTRPPEATGIQLYRDIERILTETAKQSQGGWDRSGDWSEIEGAWVLRPKNSEITSVVHFVGGIFVGAAPQLTYRLFLERLADKGVLVIATPYASGFDHFLIADEVQFKFERCLRYLQEPIKDVPTFGIGHSLGSVVHLLIGSRYAVQRSGNILMAFNNKEASLAVPLFSPVFVPMAQSFGPILSQIASSPTVRQLFASGILTETAKQSQGGWDRSGDWSEIEGAWVLRPKNSEITSVVHFVGGIFVGAAPQLTYRLFLERLADKGVLVIATPYASGFDHFLIADEVQFKFERCLRYLQEPIKDVPTFGIGHSLGSVVHLLIGSRYAVQRSGNILMAFNNKEASLAVPLFSPVFVPMAQSFGPILSQIASSPTVRLGAEMTRKQFENLSPSILKQVLPLVEQLPPLYMDLAKGREDFSPKPEETRRLIRAYYGISRNLLIKFKDDSIDETSTLAQVLSSESAISSMLDMSIRSLPGDHALPLQQLLPDVPPAMADAVNRGGEFLANLTAGTPWEAVAKEVGTTFSADTSKEIDLLVDVITSWIASNASPRLLKS